MPPTTNDSKPLWVRATSRTAGLFGVRFFNMLYGERSLVDAVHHVEPPPGLGIRQATAQDLGFLATELAPAQAKSCRIAAAQQSRCFVAVIDQRVAGFSWFNTGDIYLLSWRVQALPPEGGYTYNSFVQPQFRGQKIFQCLTEGVYSALKQAGLEFCCNLVDKNNAPSVVARKRLGALFHPAPILKLPGLDPLPLRRFPFGFSAGDPQSL